MKVSLIDWVQVLSNNSIGKNEVEDALRDAFKDAHIDFSFASVSDVSELSPFLLWVTGGVGVRHLLTYNEDGRFCVAHHASELIRSFHAVGKPIIAPCMALSIALDSLRVVVQADALTQTELIDEVVFYPKINLFSTYRPLIGQKYTHKRGTYSKLLSITRAQINYPM